MYREQKGILFLFRATPISTQHSGITPGRQKGPYWVLVIEPESVLPIVLSLPPEKGVSFLDKQAAPKVFVVVQGKREHFHQNFCGLSTSYHMQSNRSRNNKEQPNSGALWIC